MAITRSMTFYNEVGLEMTGSTLLEIDVRGNSVVKKLHKLKLKLTDEKKTIVSQVVELPPQATGICVRCFAKVEKVIKYRNEIDNIISSFEESRRRLLSKSPRSVKKRGLRSPEVAVPESKNFCERASTDNEVVDFSSKYKAILPKSKGHEDKNFTAARKFLSFGGNDYSSQNEDDKSKYLDLHPLPSGDNLSTEQEDKPGMKTFQGQGEVEVRHYTYVACYA
ncbi:uncharacterized protein LOC134251578 [Saccostrea cucullata]|uniref:uncharacterized protein LOC134251578 n=1 Tax=Saccostrea cuccullata TaxID=36930 RepID=UPI002ED0675D